MTTDDHPYGWCGRATQGAGPAPLPCRAVRSVPSVPTTGAAAGTALVLALAVAAGCAVESSGASLERAERTPRPRPRLRRPPPPRPPTTTTTEAPTVDIADLRPPAPAEDPAALAAQIEAAEATIDDHSSSELALAEAALAQQVAYRRLADRPEWDESVFAALPAHLHARAQRHSAARREFTAMHTRFSDMLPAWEIVPPVPREELMSHYLAAQEEFGVRWEHLASINLVETGMGRIRGYSVAGARGPMQFMPATWDAFGEGDIDDPRDSIRAAARYLSHSGYAQDLDRALFAYNRSNRYVRGVRLYADLMIEDPRAFDALYHWGILYRTVHGDVYLPVGYAEPERIPALEYLARPGPGCRNEASGQRTRRLGTRCWRRRPRHRHLRHRQRPAGARPHRAAPAPRPGSPPMATRRTSFAKLQRDRDKKARAAAKQERRQERQSEAEADTDEVREDTSPEGELSAAQLLVEVERLHKDFDDKKIDFETFEERKADLLSRIPVD
jgi:hypothetical protein